jgi:hypothetical protein
VNQACILIKSTVRINSILLYFIFRVGLFARTAVSAEIDERSEFVESMASMGKGHGQEVEQVKQEIAAVSNTCVCVCV